MQLKVETRTIEYDALEKDEFYKDRSQEAQFACGNRETSVSPYQNSFFEAVKQNSQGSFIMP